MAGAMPGTKGAALKHCDVLPWISSLRHIYDTSTPRRKPWSVKLNWSRELAFLQAPTQIYQDLCARYARSALRRPRPRGQEALRVEAVMLLDEEHTEASDPRKVGRRRAPDDGPGLGLGLRIIAQQRLRSILQGIPDGDIAKMREVIQMLTRAIPLSLPLSLFLYKDEVHYRVPGVVNTSEE